MTRRFNDTPMQGGCQPLKQPDAAKGKDSARRRWVLLNAFVDSGMASLEASDSSVWFALFRHAGADGRATVARGLLVSMTGLAANTVKSSLTRLCVAGWVDRIRCGGPSGGVAVYRVQRPEKVGQ